MIEKRQGDFSLLYDPVADTARLMLFDIPVARWEGSHCYVENSIGWMGFTTQRGNSIRNALKRWRALLGFDNDFSAQLIRTSALSELKSWDKFMRAWLPKMQRNSARNGDNEDTDASRPSL